MTSAHSILAQKEINGKLVRRRFTLTAWGAIPFMKVGEKRIPKQGWVQVSDSIPEEAKEIMVKKTIPKPVEVVVDKTIEQMNGKELLVYIEANNLQIKDADSLTKSQLLNEIRKVSAHN